MTAAGNKVKDHYASEGIAARILAALRAAGGREAARSRPTPSPRSTTSTAGG